MRSIARIAAAAVAASAWIGLVLEATVVLRRVGSAEVAIWELLRFFTVTTNLLVAIVFTALAFARTVHSRIVAGTALAIGLVGAVYHLLLAGVLRPSGDAALASFFLHDATPILVPLHWAAFARKGTLRWRDPVGWAIYPLCYLAYALVRGSREGRAIYFFLDIDRYGAASVARTCLLISLAFMLAGFAVVALDRALSRPSIGAGSTRGAPDSL